jgi:hypothetical protein
MRTKEELRAEAIFQALGEASMCWNPLPSTQIFQSREAEKIGNRLIEELNRIDQSQEPKQSEVSEEELNDLVDKRFVEFADITYKEGIKIGLSMKEREQTEVGEELQYQNLTCLVNGFELTTYQKGLAKKEFNRLIELKIK